MTSIFLFLSSVIGMYAAPGVIDFQREVRPILSENCFACHGPDAKTRMADLRLDLKDAAFAKRQTGTAIVAGKPDVSLVFARITEKNAAKRMPPSYSHKSLNDAQIALLRRWIEQGAPWKEHWAFQAPVKKPLPSVRNPAWVRNPIDRFVLSKLEANGLAPTAIADKRTLLRRVALDLTGLPPTVGETEAYLKDLAPNSYERMIDRYLASPRYGEHRARYWLDAARYADTHGIHVDNYREMWPYRDWVIRAFARNMPFDQFTIEQLAGDLLPNATLDQQIATGFHRCGPTTNEAGIIEDEYAEIYAKDRADTTGAVWLGMTVGCATCHDHKFDPITQKDFYALGAFFRNTTQKVMDDNIPDTPPILLVPRMEDRAEWDKLRARLRAIPVEMAEVKEKARQSFDGASIVKPDKLAPLNPKDEVYVADLEKLAATNVSLVELKDSNVAGRKALFLKDDKGVPVEDAAKQDSEEAFSISVSFFFPKDERGYVIASRQNPKERNRGWALDVGARVVSLRLFGDEGRNIEIRAGHLEQIKHGSWNHVVATYDGSRHQSGLNLFLNGRAIPTQGRGNQNVDLRGSITVDQPLLLGKSLEAGAISDFRIFNRAITESEAQLLNEWPAIEAAFAKDASSWTESDRNAMLSYSLVHQNEAFQKLAVEQTKLNAEAKAIARRGAVTHVMQEKPGATPFAYTLYRGAYDQRRQKVEASTPSILPPMSPDLPRNRLGFAKWLMSDENPAVARVTVNRMWQEVFGTGLVKTADDFGSQGEQPVNQDLLDWLAIDFRENKWDVKRFYKQILMSAAYQQSALVTPAKLAKDPDNRMLSRGSRYRMDAEMIRDYALSASGLLAGSIGGPSAKPYQPEGVWEAVAMLGSNTRFYKHDSGNGLYRRSLYTFWKRSAPPASMEIFNAPTREGCTVRRERTNTPLQALATMNDEQFVEAARVLAETAYRSSAGFDERLDFISARVMVRPLTPQERLIAKKAYQEFMTYYDSHPDDAKKLLKTGERDSDEAIPAAESAAYTMLTNQLFNLDEVLTK